MLHSDAVPTILGVQQVSQKFLDNPGRIRALGGASFLLALLQSLRTAIIAIGGIRLAIGLTALASVSGIYPAASESRPESSVSDSI